jgi:hypothetical protein
MMCNRNGEARRITPMMTITMPIHFASFPAMNTITPRIISRIGFRVTSHV